MSEHEDYPSKQEKGSVFVNLLKNPERFTGIVTALYPCYY